jgi:hypothetical protein
MTASRKRRIGTVAMLVAVALTAILGFVAVATDGGLLQHNWRIAQAVADSAALAAAESLYANYPTNQGFDLSSVAANRARAVASANGYSNDLTHSKVTVNIPPQSGDFTGKAGYVEVIVEYYQPRGFSDLWGSGPITVRGRAVATGQWVPFNTGILVLGPTQSGALTSNGGGQITVANANVLVDSNSSTAIVASGGGSFTAPNFSVTGSPGWNTSGGAGLSGNIVDNQLPTLDPLSYLPAPDSSTMTVQGRTTTSYSGTQIAIL